MNENFAPPANQLGVSGIGVAAAPTGGMGLALTEDGQIPPGVLFLDMTGGAPSAHRISFSTVTLTFTAATASAAKTITHGLNKQPVGIFLQSVTTSNFLSTNITAANSNDFTVNSFNTANVATTGSFVFYWVAIG